MTTNIKPKILHIETGRHLYGGAKQVYYLLAGLKHVGFKDNILICPDNSDILRECQGLCKIYPTKIFGDIDIFFLIKLIKIIKSEKPSLIHIHSRRGADTFGILAAKITKTKCILTRRVDNPENPILAKIKYNQLDKVVCISKGISNVLVNEGVKKEKIAIIPSAVDYDFYNQKCNNKLFLERLGLEENLFKIGMIAQFIPRKGHEFLLDCVPIILNKTKNVVFILFGQGPLQKKIAAKIREKKLDRWVKIAGFKKDIQNYLPCLDLLVHPAHMEGLGVSLLQANCSKVPIVASKVGGIPEIISHGINGYLFEPGNKDQFVSYVLDLIFDSNKRIQMGMNGQKIVRQKFSIEKMVSSYVKLYNQIIN